MTTTHQAEESAHSYPNDELLTMQEVAALVRVPLATLRFWRHLGTGPRGFRIGRSVRYWRTEVHAWIHEQGNRPQVPR